MSKELNLLRSVERQRLSFKDLCEEFGISRKIGYKWLNRYRDSEDVDSLNDQSRAPDWSPLRTHPCVTYELCRLKKKYPHWGPKKLLIKMPIKHRRKHKLPSVSTASRILKAAGLVKLRKRRRKTPPCTNPFKDVNAPNQLWCIDFKGHFKCADGTKIYPLTVTDAFSRFIFCCDVLIDPSNHNVLRAMRRIFRKFGLPEAIRSDNGVPFASVGIAGLTDLNIWWTKLGIRHERIDPGKPQQNGRHERMHLTLKREVCIYPSRSPSAQQGAFNKFIREFNFDRPHEALGMKTPNEIYIKSDRLYSKQLQIRSLPEFMNGHVIVKKNGYLEWKGNKVFVGKTLREQCLEVNKVDSTKWLFIFGPHKLGIFDEKRPSTYLKKVSPML